MARMHSMVTAVIRTLSLKVAALKGWRRLLLAFAGGTLCALSLPPLAWWPALFLGVPLLVCLIDGVNAEPRRRAFWVGWCFGLGYFAIAFYWIGAAFLVEADTYLWMMPFMVGGLAGSMAIYWGLAVLLARFSWSGGFSRLLLLAGVIAGAEILRGRLFTGFPWAPPGLAVDGMGPVAQAAALIGMTGLTFMIVLWSALPALWFGPAPSRWGGIAALIAAAALPLAWIAGSLQLRAVSAGVPGVVIRIVQPATAQSAKWRSENLMAIFDKLLVMSAQPEGQLGQPTHIVWPESAAPFLLAESVNGLKMIADRLPGNPMLITGALRRDKVVSEADGSERIYNSVMIIDGDGRQTANYDKWRLVPGGEFLPFEWLLGPLGFRKVVTLPGSFGAGPGPQTYEINNAPSLSFLICYEAIFPERLIDPQHRPGWIVNVTNDGWFGQTSGPYQHLAQARLRAIEQGIPIVRAANTGISAVIDGRGRILASLPLGSEGILDAQLPMATAPTLYAKIGDCIALLLTSLVLASSWVKFWRSKHRARD